MTNRPISKAKQRRDLLTKEIKKIYEESHQIYGAPKIKDELQKKKIAASLKLVQKLMKQENLRSIVIKKFRPASSFSKNIPRDNLISQEPTGINQVWSTDITHIHTQEGWVYLSTIMDRYSKKVIAWDMDRRMTTDLVMKTLGKAIKQRKPSGNLILHSDQGSQYTSDDYNRLLEEYGIRHSYSRKAYPYHNASLESWHGHLKREWLYRFNFKNFTEAKLQVFWYIESFYNKKRSHQSLRYLSPNQFEQQLNQAV